MLVTLSTFNQHISRLLVIFEDSSLHDFMLLASEDLCNVIVDLRGRRLVVIMQIPINGNANLRYTHPTPGLADY
jgi:hypothetical protein